jgi:hypothetical protein
MTRNEANRALALATLTACFVCLTALPGLAAE